MINLPVPIFAFLLIELLFVAYADLKYRKIKNIWSFLNLGFAVILFSSLPDIYPFAIESFQFTFAIIAGGFFLFLLKVMGGGDSKFLATFFLLIPLKLQETVFYYLLIITVLIGAFNFIRNIIHNREKLFESIKRKDVKGVKSCFGTKFAYAPVILVTWIWIGWEIFLK